MLKLQIEIRKDDNDDFENANLFYETLFAFAKSIMKYFPKLKNNKKLLLVESNFSDVSLIQYFEFLEQFKNTSDYCNDIFFT